MQEAMGREVDGLQEFEKSKMPQLVAIVAWVVGAGLLVHGYDETGGFSRRWNDGGVAGAQTDSGYIVASIALVLFGLGWGALRRKRWGALGLGGLVCLVSLPILYLGIAGGQPGLAVIGLFFLGFGVVALRAAKALDKEAAHLAALVELDEAEEFGAGIVRRSSRFGG